MLYIDWLQCRIVTRIGQMKYKNSIVGSCIAFVVATSCCWLPALALAIGGGSTIIGISNGLEKYSGIFVLIGLAFLGLGFYQYKNRGVTSETSRVILQSTLTCPECGHSTNETMPTDACQYFYECGHCKTVLKPAHGDCCVYCSYGTVKCPPIQLGQNCC